MGMTREEVTAILSAHRDALREFDVRSVSLFGSAARGEATDASDVDLYIQFATTPDFDRFMGLHLALEGWFRTKVDVVTPGSLRCKPRWRERIEREAVLVA